MLDSKMEKTAVSISIVLVVIVALYFAIKAGKLAFAGIDSVADVFGHGSESKAADNTIKALNGLDNSKNPFRPEYITRVLNTTNDKSKVLLLTVARKKELFEKINDAGEYGVFGDNPAKVILSLMRTLKKKTQVSDLATYFDNRGKDLLSTIRERVNTGLLADTGFTAKPFTELINYVNKLP